MKLKTAILENISQTYIEHIVGSPLKGIADHFVAPTDISAKVSIRDVGVRGEVRVMQLTGEELELFFRLEEMIAARINVTA